MSSVARRFTFIVDDDVALDVEECLRDNPEEAATIIAAIEDLEGDRLLCELLVDERHEDATIRSVEPFYALQDKRYNTYRVRLYEVDNWRLITGVDYRQRIIALLYVMRRDENYDETVQRQVIKAYEKLGLSRVGG